MKIHIIGPSGSGKSYLAGLLSKRYGIPVNSLDSIFWDNNTYIAKRDAATRDAMLAAILQKDSWIIEGIQHTWVTPSFAQADIIYLLEPPPWLCRIRIVRRFVIRKLSRTSRKDETIHSLIALLKWTKKFYTVNLSEIEEILESYSKKVIRISRKQDIKRFAS